MENSDKNIKLILNKLVLAPMVRINTLPFRELVYNYGCDITFTEEIIAKKLLQSHKVYNKETNTNDYIISKENTLVLRTAPSERNHLILQLGASDPSDAIKAAKIVENDIIGIDLNMGCPKHFSTHGNMGSALLTKPSLAKAILDALIETFPNKLISCKIRLLNEQDEFDNLIQMINETKIDYFTIHLRYKGQDSRHPASWDKIDFIKEKVNKPFLINGDIFCPRDIQYLMKEKACNGFMIGRGCIHNPKIFEEFKNESEDLNLVEFNLCEDNKQSLIISDKQIESKNHKDNDNNNNKDNCNVQISVKLSSALEKKYNKKAVDILPIIREFMKLCFKYDNVFGNTKYIVLYILKTHKKMIPLFQQIQKVKTYEELSSILGIKEEYEKSIIHNKQLTQINE